MDVEKYRKLFLEECRDHLQVLNREVLRLEEEGEAFDGIDTIFREAHSIKGMSASMGYNPMAALSHSLEDLFDGVRKKKIKSTQDLASLIFKGVDMLGQLTDEVEERGETTLDVGDLVRRVRAVVDSQEGRKDDAPPPASVESVSLGGSEESLPAAEIVEVSEVTPEAREDESALPDAEVVEPSAPGYQPDPADRATILEMSREGRTTYYCRVAISPDTASLSARNFVLIGKLNKVSKLIRSIPHLDDILQGKGKEVLEAVVATERPEKDLLASINSVPELDDVHIERVAAQEIKGDSGGTGEKRREIPPTPAPPSSVAEEQTRKDASRQLIDQYLPRKSTTVRVNTRILDDLINIVGEMIITRDSLLAYSGELRSERLSFSLDRLDLLVKTFQETIMAVRMMPIEVITDRFPRIVRDLSRQKKKDVHFEILGQGIEMDRAILEELNDVLIHLIRNAIDHGVEGPEERRKSGKASTALIRLSAGRERDWVWITVEDDGGGMDADKIKRKAIEKGLIEAERAATMGREEILLLSCMPGLSTADKVSDVSGRGVGMDVVKSKVDTLGGSLRIESAPGTGTRTTLRLPLTLAIVQVLLVDLRGQLFALPVSHVTHTVHIAPSQVELCQKKGVIRWGGKTIPLSDLGPLVGLEARELVKGRPFFAVLTEQGRNLSGLVVDGLVGTYEAVIKPLGLPLKKIPGLAGATVMGDGRTVLVLDLKALS